MTGRQASVGSPTSAPSCCTLVAPTATLGPDGVFPVDSPVLDSVQNLGEAWVWTKRLRALPTISTTRETAVTKPLSSAVVAPRARRQRTPSLVGTPRSC